jgi:hypothetical protein
MHIIICCKYLHIIMLNDSMWYGWWVVVVGKP